VLQAAGVRERVEHAGFVRPRGALVKWRDGSAEVTHEPSRDPRDVGFQVDRARFDALLLDAAREAGARILESTRAGSPREIQDGWLVPVPSAERSVTLAARFLVDATGKRSGFLPGAELLGARTAALYAYWRDADIDGPEARVEAGTDGWCWAAPLPDATVSAAVFLDARACAALGKRREELYLRRLAESSLLRGCLRGSLVRPVRACDASFAADEHPAGERFIRVGEAAFTLDPLSSQGVQAAITSGLVAAAVAHTLLVRPEQARLAIGFYERRQREVVARHRRFAASHYAERAALAPGPFWKARALAPDRPSAEEALSPPLESSAPRDGSRLRLAPEATIVPSPVLTGDFITDGEALAHPALPRPVAFVGEVALAPLVRLLDGADDAPAIIRRWCLTVTPSTGWALVDWLWRRRLLVPAA
jgi:flavin-dependent dehydrogenase